MEKKITKITADEIKDSRGNPTLKVTVWSHDLSDSFSVPSGASTGMQEVVVVENNQAIFNVQQIIAPALIGQNIENQKELDAIMLSLDGTKNKSNLGGNTIIGVSIAIAKTAAKVRGQETYQYLKTLAQIKPSHKINSGQIRKTPYLYMNLINGGKHADNNLAFQEYHIVPIVDNVSQSIEIGIKIQNTLKEIIIEEFGKDSIILGDEGGFAPKISDIKKPLQLLIKAIEKNNLKNHVYLALDVAASSFYKDGFYKINNKKINKDELMDIYKSLIEEFNLLSIEDSFNEEDFESFRKLREKNKGLLVVGDDLTVTNKVLLKKAIEKGSINAIIIKPNQIGTLSETLETMQLARENDINIIVSHRSGETDDDFIADLAYAFNCFGLKSGAPEKSERKVKYDRLKLISEI